MSKDAARKELAGVVPRKQVEVAIAIVFERDAGAAGSAEGEHGEGGDGGRNGGKVLICRRKADAVLGGFWEFPGGKCERGESPEACACREVREETGLEVRVVRALGSIEHEYPHARVRLHPFVCEHVGGALQPLQVAEAKWIVPADVSQYAFPEANARLVVQIARGYEPLMREPVEADRRMAGGKD